MLKKLKLGNRFILIFLLIGIIPMLLSNFLNYIQYEQEIENSIVDRLQAINNARTTNIVQLITLRQEQAKEFAGTRSFQKLKEDGNNSPELIADIQGHIDAVHTELKLPSSSESLNIDQATDIEFILVWDVNGRVIASTDRNLINKNMPTKFEKNVREKGIYFGGFKIDPATGQKYIFILEDIRHKETSSYVGSISFFMRAEIMREITTSRIGLEETGETYIIGKDYIMHTSSRFFDNSLLKLFVNTEGARACYSGASGPLTYRNYNNDIVLGVRHSLPELGWCLMTEMNVDEAFEPINRLKDQVIGMVLIFFVLIIFIASYIARSLTQPILRLNQASLDIADGQHDHEIPVEGDDEIAELTTTFNSMSQKLDKAKKQLIEKNEQLAKGLELTQSQKGELEKVNLELDRYVYTVSHDIASPIIGLTLLIEKLQKKFKTSSDMQAKERIDSVLQSARDLGKLTDELLNMTKLTRIKNPFEETDIGQLIHHVLERIKHEIEKKNIQVIIKDDFPRITCDRIKIQEVYFNLINNAIKFLPEKNKKKLIECGFSEEDDLYTFTVKDNGIGIAPDDQKKIFEAFRQVSQPQTSKGVGLGLFITKTLVNEHGGTLDVESSLGEGTTIIFTIAKNLPL